MMPSECVRPSKVDTAPQQASTSPEDGTHVHQEPEQMAAGEHGAPGEQGGKVPFKEQVLGYAKKTRGTLLAKPDLKQQGEKLIQGEGTIKEPPPL